MPRPVRRRLTFDEESANKLFQEIYDESHNIKAKITRLFTKWELKVKEGGEIQAIGDQIVKLIAAEAKNQDQKIMLLKFLKEVVFDNSVKAGNSTGGVNGGTPKTSSEESSSGDISAERRMELLNMVSEHFEKKDREKNKE
jgi:hypothetical protein